QLFQICNERPDGWLIEQPPVRRRLFHDSARSRIFSANWACGLRGDGYHPRAISTQSKRVLTKRRGFMKIRPLQDRILVRRVKEEEKTKGGIIIPDTAKEKPVEGEIVAVGTGKVLEGGKIRPLDVKAGDRILFGKYAGNEITVDGVEHLSLREDEVLGVVEK